jgi:alcohol dehydrogenase class IV
MAKGSSMEINTSPAFEWSRSPRIVFGPGRFAELPEIAAEFGRRLLVVTGGSSFKNGGKWDALNLALATRGLRVSHAVVDAEPTPAIVDAICKKYGTEDIDVVVAIGGGSVIDAAKAVAAMLGRTESVADYLDGAQPHPGDRRTLIAVPTTSGSGSEATGIAVLRVEDEPRGKLRLVHPGLTPDIALVDPELLVSCPRHVTIAGGLDTLTQLVEAYVSSEANPLSETITFSGLIHFAQSFFPVLENPLDLGARGQMAYATLMSGLALQNVGLGVAHGLANPLGGMFDMPHGLCCATLLPVSIGVNVHYLRHHVAGELTLAKYAMLGHLLSEHEPTDIDSGCDALIETLNEWINTLEIPRLRDYGVTADDFDRILDAADVRNNPVDLPREDMGNILKLRL